MKLTPLDIRHKEFKRGMRGYADEEVDEFLDEVADEYERLFKDNIDLSERLESLEEKVAGYRRIEETLQKTLVSAQQSAEELKTNANKEAQLILRDAELKARQMVSDLYSDRQNLEKSIAEMSGVEQDMRFKLKTMLETFLRQLEEAPRVTTEPPADDFASRAQAIKDAIAREDTQASPPRRERRAAPPEPPAGDDGGAGSETARRDAPPTAESRVVVGEDDLLADVDSEVNEDEFKW